MEYRDILPSDIPSLFEVRTRTRENRYSLDELHALGITCASVEAKLAGSHAGWLCQVRGRTVGFCMADGATGELWVIAVLPAYEGRGIGARLMEWAESWLWSRGCEQAWLTTDLDPERRAYGFYRKRGWTDWKVENGLRYMRLFPPPAPGPAQGLSLAPPGPSAARAAPPRD